MQIITGAFLDWKTAIERRDSFLDKLMVRPADFPEKKEILFSLYRLVETRHHVFFREVMALNGQVWFEVSVEGGLYTGKYLFDQPFILPDLVLIRPTQILRVGRKMEFLRLLDCKSKIHQLGVVCTQEVKAIFPSY